MKTIHDQTVREQALDITKSFLVKAPAGSGKTDLLIKRLLTCLAYVDQPENVLAITFTNKAVNEGRQRVYRALKDAIDGVPTHSDNDVQIRSLANTVLERDKKLDWHLIENIHRIRFVTIDRYCRSIACAVPMLSGFGGLPDVADDPYILYEKAVSQLLKELDSTLSDSSIKIALVELIKRANNRYDLLSTWLTSLLSHREQWLMPMGQDQLYSEDHILSALVSEKLERLHNQVSVIGLDTVLQQLSLDPVDSDLCRLSQAPGDNADQLGDWQTLAKILLTSTSLLRRKLTKREGFIAKHPSTLVINEWLANLHSGNERQLVALEKSLAEVLILPDPAYPIHLARFREHMHTVLVRLVGHLQLVFQEHNQVDFTEITLRAIQALGSDEDISDVLLRKDHLIQHILLDETQDTSLVQYYFLQKLTSGWEPGDGRSLFMVGDYKQSIYRFRQADVGYFIKLWNEGQFGNISLERISLTSNFRSAPTVVDWYNQTFNTIFPQQVDSSVTATPYDEAKPVKDDIDGSCVRVYGVDQSSAVGDDSHCVSVIQDLIKQHPNDQIAVLVRSRSHLFSLTDQLDQQDIRYACQDLDSVNKHRDVSDFVQLIRALYHPYDRVAWIAVLKSAFVGILWEDIVQLLLDSKDLSVLQCMRDHERLKHLSSDAVSRILDFVTHYDETLDQSTDLAHTVHQLWHRLGGHLHTDQATQKDVSLVLEVLAKHCKGGQLQDVHAFIRAADKIFVNQLGGQINILTIHKAKGLEFDHVVIQGLGQRTARSDKPLLLSRQLPHGFISCPLVKKTGCQQSIRLYEYLHHLERQSDANELIRLLYVAITRAKKSLHLIGSVNVSEGIASPSPNSPFKILWPAIASSVEIIHSSELEVPYQLNTLSRKQRDVSVDWPDNLSVRLIQTQHASQRSDKVLSFKHQRHEVKFLGTAYHAAMDVITKRNGHFCHNSLTLFTSSLLRRLGLADQYVKETANNVVQLVDTTCTSGFGRWLFNGDHQRLSEHPLTATIGGKVNNCVIDLLVLSKDTVFVIDYKVNLSTRGRTDVNSLYNLVSQYRHQMNTYIDVISANFPDLKVTALFYLPSTNQLCDLHGKSFLLDYYDQVG